MLKHHVRENLIWDSNLSSNELLLLLALNAFVDGNGECFPSQDTLAKMCKFSDRTVRTSVKSLEVKGIIEKVHRYDKSGKRTSDLYRINFDLLRERPPEEDISTSLPEDISTSLPEDISTSLPEDISTSLPEDISTSLPEDISTSGGDYRKKLHLLPEKIAPTTGKIFQGSYPGSIQGIDPDLLPPTPFPEDKQKASMNASLVRSRIFRSGLNDWNEPLIAAWISLWKQSGRDPGTDGINLRSFVRKNLHPSAEKHASMLDELSAAEKIAERTRTPATYQPPPEPELDPNFKPPTVAEILARRGRAS